MEDEIGMPQMVRVKDEAGNEYLCPASELTNPQVVSEDEKGECELKKLSQHMFEL